jgi:2-polyprenyl-3-methyl-5-hydroxy-6-metoxy-1,4-benzoquinol methylase
MENYDNVKADFNEIAELGSDPKWNHNNCYFPYLLRQIPLGTEICIDIGCGKGELSALLSKRVNRVIAVDLADKMIEYAGPTMLPKTLSISAGISWICFFLHRRLTSSFQQLLHIISHTVGCSMFAKDKLHPGGKLIILDLAKPDSIMDYIVGDLP